VLRIEPVAAPPKLLQARPVLEHLLPQPALVCFILVGPHYEQPVGLERAIWPVRPFSAFTDELFALLALLRG
jgi:hypothetical protein